MENIPQEREMENADDEETENVARQTVVGRRLALRLRHNRAKAQGSKSSVTCHAVYAFMVMSLIGLLQVKYQNKNESPFETHPISIGAFAITMCAYCLAMVAKNYASNYSKIFSRVSLMLAALSSVSLASILLPSSVSSLIIFSIWGLLSVIESRNLFQAIFQWFYRKVADAIVQVLNVYTRFLGRRLMEQQLFLV